MILTLHGVFLTYLVAVLAWNASAEAPPDGVACPGWRRWGLPALHLMLAGVLLADRLAPARAPLLEIPVVGALFPLAFALALAQNAAAMLERGARLTDIPIVLYNVGLGTALVCASLALGGVDVGRRGDALLYDHHIVQLFVGSHLAWLTTLSWHVPMLLRRRTPATLPGLMGGLLPAALAAFVVLVMVALHGESAEVIASFDHEPAGTPLRADLGTGVMVEADEAFAPVPGSLDVWTLPADHDGAGLPTPRRPLVLQLRAPDGWLWRRPDLEQFSAAFLDGAERLCAALHPALLLPFPDPDAVAPLLLGRHVEPEQWRALYERARARVAAVSPGTRLAVRLGGTGERSAALFATLARPPSPVDAAGPRLLPGNAARGGPAWSDEILATWHRWREQLTAPPELWVLAAGCSPLAYGEQAAARFLDGCLARASRDPEVAGVLIQGWRDRGHTLGLLRPDGEPRAAGVLARRRLPAAPPTRPTDPDSANR